MAAPNTPAAKTERLLNLTMTLLYARMPAPKQRIRQMVEAYRAIESDEAFDRMFERDKEDLRAMGIPLVTEDIGVFEDEQGYRIDRRDYALPPVELAADERAVVDPELEVIGVEGLRVADASIMPSITGGNTNAPSYMIGEMCARFLGA